MAERTYTVKGYLPRRLVSDWQYPNAMGGGVSYDDLRNPKTESGKAMTSFLGKLPVHEGVTYRGLVLEDDQLHQLASAKGYELNLHSSSSKDEATAIAFANGEFSAHARVTEQKVVLEVRGRGREINHLLDKDLQDTKEVVLMAGTKYRFKGVETIIPSKSGDRVKDQALLKIKLEEVR